MFHQQPKSQEFDFEAYLDIPPGNQEHKDHVINEPTFIKKVQKSKPKPVNKKRKQPGKIGTRKVGHWELEENKRYHWFLQIYHHHFINRHLRRTERIFKIMENFLGTREAEQCRSHHQKMQKRYGTFKRILLHLRFAHYETQQSYPILQDLIQNGVDYPQGLVSKELLHNETEQTAKKNEEMQNKRCEQEIKGMQEQGKLIDNLLEDGYSNCMDLNSGFFS